MDLTRIIQSDTSEQQVICLREQDGPRTFPILVGEFEAGSINRGVRGEPAPRPLTHELALGLIEELGGELQDVVVSSLQDHTYFALVRVRQDGELRTVDSRPSDAIALAVHHDPPVPIYVADEVLEEVA